MNDIPEDVLDELDRQYLAALETNLLPTRHPEGQEIAVYVAFESIQHRYTTSIKGVHFSPQEKGLQFDVRKIVFLGGKLRQLVLCEGKWIAIVSYENGSPKDYDVAIRFLNAKSENEY